MEDFKLICDEMKMHGMEVPPENVLIGIKEARSALENYFRYFLSFSKKEFVWQPEYALIVNWLENNKGRGLFLYGDCGRGKSLLARYIIPAILLKYERKVVNVFNIQDVNSCIDEVLKKHIISLDDVGTEDVSSIYGNKRYAFPEIVDAAEKYGKLVIISTNLNGNEIIEKYGSRTMDRIIATTTRIEFKGKSLRK